MKFLRGGEDWIENKNNFSIQPGQMKHISVTDKH